MYICRILAIKLFIQIMADKKLFLNIIFLLAVGIIQFGFRPVASAENSSNIGVLLADDQGKPLYSQNSEKQFIPASIMKILTSLAAIHFLGENHHYPTDYSFNKITKDLFIRGNADPLFISEEIKKLCRQIQSKLNHNKIRHIILDHTYFSNGIQVPGKGYSLNPYDAPVGALCANFNTVVFKWNHEAGRHISGEPQTPLLLFFNDRIKNTNLKKGRIILSESQSRLYPGLLIQYFLKENGIKVTGKISEGGFDDTGGKKHQFLSSFKTTDIVQKLLQFSNNFIANQLLLTIGVSKYSEPATLQKGVNALDEFAKHDLGLNGIQITEGSGLSRTNRISPNQMVAILLKFKPYHALLNKNDSDYYKTGTLDGVRTRAGYIIGKNDRLYPYVIMVNQKNKGYKSIHGKLTQMVSLIGRSKP